VFSGADESETARPDRSNAEHAQGLATQGSTSKRGPLRSTSVRTAKPGTPGASIEERREAWLQKRYAHDVTEGVDGPPTPRPAAPPRSREPRVDAPVTQDQLRAAQARILAQMPEERAAFEEINANVDEQIKNQDKPLPNGYPPVYPVGQGPAVQPLEEN
jgi:hypothetical protein